MYPLLRPLLFRLDPETAHCATLNLLDAAHRAHCLPAARYDGPFRRVMGLDFPNPVGLAAGLDKDAAHIDALAALGFGFIEVGTVTPRPQPGNPRPRMFRLPAARAVINRMGFNNGGVERLVENVRRARYRGILGINIGKNFDTPLERAADDYLACLRAVYPVASYVTVNISSPNTRNLRQLQQARELDILLAALADARTGLTQAHGRRVPMALKVAPDLAADEIGAVAEQVLAHGMDAVIATNTTLSRDGVQGLPHADEAGGLSGAPLRRRALEVVTRLRAALGRQVPIIGVGGIMSGADAAAMMAAGADLVQVYSGLVYRGPGLVREICHTLEAMPEPSVVPA